MRSRLLPPIRRHVRCASGFLLLTLVLAYPRALLAQARLPRLAPCDSTVRIDAGRLSGVNRDFLRLVELTGAVSRPTGLILRASDLWAVPICADPRLPWTSRIEVEAAPNGGNPFYLLPVRADIYHNSELPDDRNNGAVWAGRGFSSAVSAGVHARIGPLSAAVAPELTYVGDRWTRVHAPGPAIDWPPAAGDSTASYRLFPGQSYVRVDAYGMAAGVSTENLWWGPGIENPLLFSNTAPGFRHAFLRTAWPRDIGIGRLEGEVIYGELRESRGYDDDPANDRRLIGALGLALHPRGLPGLALGVGVVYEAYPDSNSHFLSHLFAVGSGGKSAGNAIGAVFARWLLPESDFAVHLEVARDDAWEDLADLVKQPDHAMTYELGLQKGFATGAGQVLLAAEVTHLEAVQSYRDYRPAATMYTHIPVLQGHTQEGQLLGPAIGPGANSQWLSGDLFAGWGGFGVVAQRVVRGDLYVKRTLKGVNSPGLRDVEHRLALRGTIFAGPVDLHGSLAVSNRPHPGFVDEIGDVRVHALNVGLELHATWRPRP